jgi:hypothetical protein
MDIAEFNIMCKTFMYGSALLHPLHKVTIQSTFENVRLASYACVCVCMCACVRVKSKDVYTTHHTLAIVSRGPTGWAAAYADEESKNFKVLIFMCICI